MTKTILVLSVIFGLSIANAQTFKVTKIAGKKAIVEVSDPGLISVGETYNVGEGGSSTTGGPTSFKREYGIDLSGSIESRSGSTSVSLAGGFLWNMKSYEFGPILSIFNASGGGTSITTTGVGAIGYYNFVENKVGNNGIPSVVGRVSMLSQTGSSSTNISAGGNYRWFMLSGDHALSFSALYNMQQTSGNSTSYISIEAGIATYF